MTRRWRVLSKLHSLLRNQRADEDSTREVASYLALLRAGFERRGMSADEARPARKRAYDGVELAKQAHRDERSVLWIEQTIQDIHYALRMLAKSPGLAQRTPELGICMALGAQKRDLMRLVVWRGLLLAFAGAIIGIGASMAVSWLMASLLYSVRPNDPATFGGVSMLIVLVAFAACSIPARRAILIEPMAALREE